MIKSNPYDCHQQGIYTVTGLHLRETNCLKEASLLLVVLFW